MADNPDPTRRLRPLLEARAQRRTARSAEGPEERIDVGPGVGETNGATPRHAEERAREISSGRERISGRQLDRSDAVARGDRAMDGGIDARGQQSDAPAPADAGRRASGGWIPSWADDDESGEAPGAAGAAPPRPRRRMGAAPSRELTGPDRPGGRPGGHHRAPSRVSRGGGRRDRYSDEHRDDEHTDADIDDIDIDIDIDMGSEVDGCAVAGSGVESSRWRRLSDAAEPVAGSRRAGWRPWMRWRERWVPAGPGMRVDPGRRGGAVISMVAAAAVVVSALGLFRNEGTVVAPSTVAVVDGGPTSSISEPLPVVGNPEQQSGDAVVPPGAGASAPASPPPTVDIVVAVTGSVRQPGIVTLPAGSRVADAIGAAGGVVDGTDYTGLNLAARLADGDSVVVGGSGQGLSTGSTAGPGAAAAAAPGLVDLNAADQAALETLPGVGPVMAGNIIAWRSSNGGFRSVDELQEITGIGPARFATLAPLVRVG